MFCERVEDLVQEWKYISSIGSKNGENFGFGIFNVINMFYFKYLKTSFKETCNKGTNSIYEHLTFFFSFFSRRQ